MFEEFSYKKGALISQCGKYRYTLWRVWDESKPAVMFIMLNPSTADAMKDDPTIRRCIGFAKDWGYGGLYVCNLFAFRSKNPKELLKVDNPFGDENIFHIRKVFDKVEKVICAWGNYPIVDKIMKGISEYNLISFASEKLHYIDLTNTRRPKHPLYLPKNLTPKPFIKRNMKKILKVEVTYTYSIEIDSESDIVKEYKSDTKLIEDLASYRFTTLPVINNGVQILDVQLESFSL